MNIQPLDIVIHIINIGVLFVLLRVLVYRPVSKFMRERAGRVQSGLDAAKERETEAAAKMSEYEETIARADEDAKSRAAKIVTEADAQASEIISAARAEAQEIVAEANERAKRDAEAQLERMRGEIASISVEIAGRILEREIGDEDNRAIADRFFESAGKKA